MKLRSLLFVPGDRPERFEKAAASGADAIILDLEDSVAAQAKPRAREAVQAFLSARQSTPVLRLVRINPLTGDEALSDIAYLEGADGVVLPKSEGSDTVASLLALIGPHVSVLPIATETPQSVFGLGGYAQVRDRLLGLTWGAEDLPAAIGAISSRTSDGFYTSPYDVVRSLMLFGAHAAQVNAIETVYPAIRDQTGLCSYAARGVYDGFTGMMALHPSQVPIINSAFTPSQLAIDAANRVLDAFAKSPGAGVLMLDGRMVDAPHLLQARKVLERAGVAHESLPA